MLAAARFQAGGRARFLLPTIPRSFLTGTPLKASEITKKTILLVDNDALSVKSVSTVKPGKGGAFAQVEAVSISAGTKKNMRFRTTESVEEVRLDPPMTMQLLYMDGDGYAAMDMDTFEQMTIPLALFGDGLDLVREGQQVTLRCADGEVLNMDLPTSGVFRVDVAHPLRDDTRNKKGVWKRCVLDTGRNISLPRFVEAGDWVRLRMPEGDYVERVPESAEEVQAIVAALGDDR